MMLFSSFPPPPPTTASAVGKYLVCLLIALVHPIVQGVFSEHRPVLAAAPCVEKGQRGCLLVELPASCPGASWYLLPFGFFLPPTTWARQTGQSQICWLCPRSPRSTCQQARLSSGISGSLYSNFLLRRGWLPVLNQISCGFV